VGRINGDLGKIGAPAVHYLHHSYPREEMAALFQAADVMLVTPLRDGMNLVAKEYVTCRHDLGGALVLSEFTGAWHELHQAFACNPHDIEGLKQTILRAINTPAKDKQRIMRALRRRVADHDVQRWAARYLAALDAAPEVPPPTTPGSARSTDPSTDATAAQLSSPDAAPAQTRQEADR
jgi:trehalose 6-phosphate synthase